MEPEKANYSLIKSLLERTLEEGSVVWYDNKPATVQTILSVEEVRIKLESGDCPIVPVNLLSREAPPPMQEAVGTPGEEVTKVEEKRILEAHRKRDAIRPFIHHSTKKELAVVSETYGYSVSALYDWIKFYKYNPEIDIETDISYLLPIKPSGGKGGYRLGKLAEEHTKAGIESYLSRKQLPIPKVIENIQDKCKMENEGIRARNKVRLATESNPTLEEEVKIPSAGAIRYKIKQLDEAVVAERRYGKRAAHQYKLNKDVTTEADYPLQLVQLDHKTLDVMLVDEEGGSIGRAYITVAIDVFSRMLAGYHISLDPTGMYTTGICIANALLPKTAWLGEMELTAKWDVWGAPANLHVDNALEFRSQKLAAVCHAHGINMEFRPVRTPHYGGYIESFMKTVDEAMKGLDGAIFKVKDKSGQLKEQWLATFTLSALEQWFAHFVTGKYHIRVHQGIRMTPMAKFEKGVMHPSYGKVRIGVPPPIAAQDRLRIDFLPQPQEPPTVQKYGIKVAGFNYKGPVVAPYVGKKIPGTRKGVKHIVRINPNKMWSIYFFNPKDELYYKIPRRQRPIGREPTLWEVEAAREALTKAGKDTQNEELLDKTIRKMHEIELEQAHKTAKARRKLARKGASKKSKVYQDAEEEAAEVESAEPDNVIAMPQPNKARPFKGIILRWGA